MVHGTKTIGKTKKFWVLGRGREGANNGSGKRKTEPILFFAWLMLLNTL
jgi:hypothetical protein